MLIGPVEITRRRLDRRRADALYLHRERFAALCRECPLYGARWGCPPLEPGAVPESCGTLELMMVSADIVEWDPSADPVADMTAAMQSMRPGPETELLRSERRTSGRAALFTGRCRFCSGQECARVNGRPCCHPDMVRPSLEALGYDLGAIAAEVFRRPLEWYRPGAPLPRRLTLIGGLFY